MNILNINSNYYLSNSIGVSLFGFFIIGLLLILGRKIKLAVQLERFGLPIAVISGIIGIVVGPYGALHLLSNETIDLWGKFPTPLLAIVFATLMLGRPVPNVNGLFKPIINQFLLALALGFGQFFVGGLVVKYLFPPSIDFNPLMGCLIEVGFEGGHGAASIIGESFNKLGFPDGLDLGLAMATMGLLSSSIVGSLFLILGKIINPSSSVNITLKDNSSEINNNFSIFANLRILLINLAFSGLAIFLGILLLRILRFFSNYFGD